MLSAKTKTTLMLFKRGVARALGIKDQKELRVVMLPPLHTPYDILGQTGYFGVVVNRGEDAERFILFSHERPTTVARMIREIAQAPPELWNRRSAAIPLKQRQRRAFVKSRSKP